MRKAMMVCGLMAAACFVVVTAKAQDKKEEAKPAAAASADKAEAPEFITFDKAKLGEVKFPHKKHGEMLGCDACHGGEKPLFAKKFEGGLKMKDMKEGKSCGACHNGKEMAAGKEKKTPFSTTTKCMNCHKKKA